MKILKVSFLFIISNFFLLSLFSQGTEIQISDGELAVSQGDGTEPEGLLINNGCPYYDFYSSEVKVEFAVGFRPSVFSLNLPKYQVTISVFDGSGNNVLPINNTTSGFINSNLTWVQGPSWNSSFAGYGDYFRFSFDRLHFTDCQIKLRIVNLQTNTIVRDLIIFQGQICQYDPNDDQTWRSSNTIESVGQNFQAVSPFHENIQIIYTNNNSVNSEVEYTIKNLEGKFITKNKINLEESNGSFQIKNIYNLSSGMYFIQLKHEDDLTLLKLIKN